MKRFWDKVDKSGDCWEWTAGKNAHGYGTFRVNSPRRKVKAHRWSFEDANGYLPDAVRHTCDNTGCVRPSHLLPGTQADNLRDMDDRGRRSRHNSKMSMDMVEHCRSNPFGLNQRELGHLSGVSQSAISNAVRGLSYV